MGGVEKLQVSLGAFSKAQGVVGGVCVVVN